MGNKDSKKYGLDTLMKDITEHEEQFKLVVNSFYYDAINDIYNNESLMSDPYVQMALQINTFDRVYKSIKHALNGEINMGRFICQDVVMCPIYHRVRIYLSTVADHAMNLYANNYFGIPKCMFSHCND